MKETFKNLLRHIRVYYALNYLRQMPSIVQWLGKGCPSPAPHAIKMNVVRYFLRQYNLDQFIETGTFQGETLEYIAREGVNCISVELSEKLHTKAIERFSNFKNVTLIQGDSSQEIINILEKLDQPALFWLDGHYSGGITAHGEKYSPVSAELEAIQNHTVNRHVILIDDARLFNGNNYYTFLDDFLREIRQKGFYQAEVTADIIRLIPRAVA